ncbi:MAG: hypothetical protein ACRCZP_14365, partial [Phycicoccus sp.]
MHNAPPLHGWQDPNPYGSLGPGPMSRRWVAVIVSVGIVCAAMLASPVVWLVLFYGCRGVDYALADDLAASEWLRLAPPGTEPSGPSSADCEDDDDIAMGTQEHLRRAVDMSTVLEFYRRELTERG